MTEPLKVVQWATGNVGGHAVAAVHDHPDLELVGALVYTDTKAGRDVGEICGTGEIGVTATKDPEQIFALDADCVLYMAQGEWNPSAALDDVCRLLASGKNVVSTAVTAWIYPESSGGDVVERLEAACEEGQTSFHGTGIEPGWAAEVLPLTMSGLFRRIDSLRVQELMDYTTYNVPFVLIDVMGFGKDPNEPVPMDEPAIGGLSFKAPLMLLADGLGATVDDYVWEREVAVTDTPIDITAGRIDAGTVSAQRFAYTAIIEGRPALTVEHITRLGADQAPHWPNGRGWKVTVEGLPSMVLESRIAIHDEDDTDQGCLGTAMHAVHAIAPVCAAAPGIRTFLDLPTIVGRGVLSRGLRR
ncbi:dihydrodipicolinate reductase [Mycobacterium kyorinense]|uniref:Dihydrodipicolinate reductase n=1 Tax=Mycobacterium kyorinense TaxID=487514 RepID=A0A1A2ZHE6_9MYCO|nr:dihydrodipicolinate reductase [Mycobacterium kyorinense]OBI50014.1 dihydrodipicolinate reductase [Mycobacterium kyorinense]